MVEIRNRPLIFPALPAVLAVLVAAALFGPGLRDAAAQESSTAVGAAAAETQASATGQSPAERKQALAEEAAQKAYLSARPFISRYVGFAVFLVLCLILIAFLRKRIEQREQLQRIGFVEAPEIEPEED